MSGLAPYGFRRDSGRLVPEPTETAVVEKLAELFVSLGGRVKATATAMNTQGHKTRRGSWTDTAVSRVIRNEALHEVLSGPLWRQVRTLLERRKTGGRPGRRSAHALSGIVRCGCGAGSMVYRKATGKLACGRCKRKLVLDAIERAFVESLGSISLTTERIEANGERGPGHRAASRKDTSTLVRLSDLWSRLDEDEKHELVDLLVARLVVEDDRVHVVFAVSEGFKTEKEATTRNSLPKQHSFATSDRKATQHVNGLHPIVRPTRSPAKADVPLEPKAYRVHQVAEILNLPKSTVYDMVRTGKIPSVRVGNRRRNVRLVPADALAKFLEPNPVSKSRERS